MSSTADTDICIQSHAGTAQALYFKSGEKTLFGWLHRPQQSVDLGGGLVICNPFGYESICAHRAVRDMADTAMAAGVAVLRFDYLGTGDSDDIEESTDQLAQWSSDVIAAVQEFQRRTSVRRVCLAGIRLGALIATRAAESSPDVAALLLIAPVVAGQRYVRELRTAQLAGLAMSQPGNGDGLAGTKDTVGLEVGGFVLSPATLEALSKVNLQTSAAPTCPMLIIDNDKLPSAGRWMETLSGSQSPVDYKVLPGVIEMVMTAPQFTVVPREIIAAACDWLTSVAADPSTRAKSDSLPSPEQEGDATEVRAQVLTLGDPNTSQTSVSERPVVLSSDVALFGIVTEPCQGEVRRRCVILLNPGADFHIGASRMYVSLARRWARRGYVVLRLDLAGIGDSATRQNAVVDDVFPDEALSDIRCAVEYMRTHYGTVDVALAGLCSGAYHALRAAADGVRVNRILMVNPQNYHWKKGMTLQQLQLAEVVHNPGVYRQRVFSLHAWRRVLTGQVRIGRIAIIYAQRLRLTIEAALWNAARAIHLPLPNDVGRKLERIAANGVRITFLFAKGEPGIELLKLQGGSAVDRLGERCRIRIVDSGDHIFSRRRSRSIMEDVLSEELFARLDADGDGRPAQPTATLSGIAAK